MTARLKPLPKPLPRPTAPQSWRVGKDILGLSFSPDGQYALTAGMDEHVQVWRLSDHTRVAHFGVPIGVVCWKAVMSPERIVAAGFGDLTVHLWSLDTGRELHCIGPLGGIVASLEFSADGRHLFMGNCGDNILRMVEVATGAVTPVGKTRKSGSWFVALSPDASKGLSAAGDKLVHVWDLAKGTTFELAGHQSKLNEVAFFPDGRRAASASSDKTVRLWDVGARKKELACLVGHRKAVASVAVSRDGKLVASGGLDDVAILWDVARKRELGRFAVTRGGATSVALSPNGQELLVGGTDGVLRLYPIH